MNLSSGSNQWGSSLLSLVRESFLKLSSTIPQNGLIKLPNKNTCLLNWCWCNTLLLAFIACAHYTSSAQILIIHWVFTDGSEPFNPSILFLSFGDDIEWILLWLVSADYVSDFAYLELGVRLSGKWDYNLLIKSIISNEYQILNAVRVKAFYWENFFVIVLRENFQIAIEEADNIGLSFLV